MPRSFEAARAAREAGPPSGVCRVCGAKAYHHFATYCEEHRPPKEEKAQTAQKRPSPRSSSKVTGDRIATPVGVASVVGGGGEKLAESKPPTKAEWQKRLTDVVVMVTMLMVRKPVRLSDLDIDEWEDAIDYLKMTPLEAEALASPVANLLTGPLGGDLNKRYGRAVFDVAGLVPAGIAFSLWQGRLAAFRKEHIHQGPVRPIVNVAPGPQGAPTDAVSSNGRERPAPVPSVPNLPPGFSLGVNGPD